LGDRRRRRRAGGRTGDQGQEPQADELKLLREASCCSVICTWPLRWTARELMAVTRPSKPQKPAAVEWQPMSAGRLAPQMGALGLQTRGAAAS
jgi:hypothetical protein